MLFKEEKSDVTKMFDFVILCVLLLLFNGRIYMDRWSKPTNIELLFEMGRKHRMIVYLLNGNPSIDGYSYNWRGTTNKIIKNTKVRLVYDIENSCNHEMLVSKIETKRIWEWE